ncbi:MAG: Hsp70 family protein [Ramlibacter sp.]|nr:Hsp70 family protein [Ramlibacter sp.]
MTAMALTLGIDFGTSNSAAAWRADGGPARPLALEGDAHALPTAIFFNAEERKTHFGRDAVTQYLAGTEGRLMRSLKSLLGSALLLETTEVNGQGMSYQDIIGTFLKEVVARARAQTGAEPERVVLGRPVHFVDDDPQRDALAQQMLLQAAQAAGLRHVGFQLEPIAAAFDYEQRLDREQLVLVTDIGGGTSDFTVVRLGPQRARRGGDRGSDILATRGVHIGGADFDQKLSLEQAMPLLGFRHVGPQQREVPSPVFFDLATWHLIHWRYGPRALREAQALRVNYSDLTLHRRLMTVLEQRLGHHLANDVEQAKIGCSRDGHTALLALDYIERGLSASLDAPTLTHHLAPLLQRVVQCALDCVQEAGLRPGELDAVYLTGGSSALTPFQQALQQAFAGTPLVEGDLFGGVAAGLVYGARA